MYFPTTVTLSKSFICSSSKYAVKLIAHFYELFVVIKIMVPDDVLCLKSFITTIKLRRTYVPRRKVICRSLETLGKNVKYVPSYQ